jgi:hypothetical protein
MFSVVDRNISASYPFFKFSLKAWNVHKKIRSTKKSLEIYVHEPDQETQDINTKESSGQGLSVKVKEPTISGEAQSKQTKSKEMKKQLLEINLIFLKLSFPIINLLLI